MSGVYIFDRFIFYLRKEGFDPIMQIHDEIILDEAKWDQDKAFAALKKAIKLVNEEVKLNVELKIDFKVGNNYADIH